MRTLFALLISFSLSAQVYNDAVGWGSSWTFPASYEVYIVTNTDNAGAGSLRDALTSSIAANGRIVVFNGLSGTITLSSEIAITSTKPIYIAGQTSENGILLRASESATLSHLISLNAGSHIIRGLTFAYGIPATVNYCCGDNLNVFGGSNHIIDQCTFLWGTDGNIDMIRSSKITIQRSIIAETLRQPTGWSETRSLASLFSDGLTEVSLYRNLYAFNRGRNPLWGGGSPGPPGNFFEMAQNVVVGWEFQGVATTARADLAPYDLDVSFINNVFVSRDYTSSTRKPLNIDGGTANGSQHTAYVRDNYDDRFRVTGSEAQNANLAYSENVGDGIAITVVTDPTDWTVTPFGYPLDGVFSLTRESVLSAVYGGVGDLNDAGGLTSGIIAAANSGAGGIIDSPSQSVTGGYPVISATAIINDTDLDGIPDGDEEVQWGDDTFGYVNALAGSGAPPTQAGPLAKSVKQTSAMLIAH